MKPRVFYAAVASFLVNDKSLALSDQHRLIARDRKGVSSQ